MEKSVAFLPLIIFFSVFALLTFLFFRFVFRLIKKAKDSYWIGKVIDKKSFETTDSDDKDVTAYYLVVQTDEGKEKNVSLSKQLFDGFEVGDRIEKPKGVLHPKKL
ncbi:MAG: hypothetical protein WAX66_02945 [Patescibacteria group bacterium]